VIGLFMTIFTWIGTDVSGAHFNPITTVNNLTYF
jgi:glycerol uptake facilitator-like aquaporin